MSQERVELVRQAYEAFNRGDLDAVLSAFDEQIAVHDPPEIPDSAIHRGHAAVMRDWQRTFDSFEEFSAEIEDCQDVGDEELLIFVRFRGRGRGSGVPVEAEVAHLLTIRNGKLLRMRQFMDRKAALEAAGVRA